MQYTISLLNPLTHLLEIELSIQVDHVTKTEITLPIWRPGRYEAAYYSKNIRGLQFFDQDNKTLEYIKPDAHRWLVDTTHCKTLRVRYQYFAFTMDAGNSWYGESLLYINFINCLLYCPNEVDMPCSVAIDIPKQYKVACALPVQDGAISSKSYCELVDSPLVASQNLEELPYTIGDVDFHIWIYGDHQLDKQLLVNHFEKFSQTQIDTFGEFPERSYHFLILVLPYKFYHGVEHAASTVICLGPGNEIHNEKIYPELLGVSSHELFHAWNIIKIRPEEMMPYVFNKEVTFPTGFVAEGFTTYYGDLFLSRSQVFDKEAYFKELNTLLNRHFWNYGRLNESVVTSSLNLWVDGYTNGAPNKKSSIYVEGAMVALCLDLLIRKESNSQKSLDDVMRLLWKNHGLTGKGYSYENIKEQCEEVIGHDLDAFFNDYVRGTTDKKAYINSLLNFVGCELGTSPNENALTRQVGIRCVKQTETWQIVQIAADSLGEQKFSLQDEIIKIDGKEVTKIGSLPEKINTITLQRMGKKIEISVDGINNNYFDQHFIKQLDTANKDQQEAFTLWTGQNF